MVRRPIQHVLVLILIYGLTFLPITAYSSGSTPSTANHPTKPTTTESKITAPLEPRPAPPIVSASPDGIGQERTSEAYGSIPVSFVANEGQTDSQVKYLSSGGAFSLFLTGTDAVMVLSKRKARRGDSQVDQNTASDEALKQNVIRMKLAGANSHADVVALNERPWKTNYFIGNDTDKWKVGVASYGTIKYQDVYPGVDMVYHGKGRQLEYDFVIAPHIDPNVIRINFDGAETLRINKDGDLLLNLKDGGELRQRAPVIYQEGDNGQERINGRFIIINKRNVGFDVGEYDHEKPLVIDPVLNYSTYLGGGNDDRGNSIAIDASGNAYVTGSTSSVNFPVAGAFQSNLASSASNVFVTKLNASGTAILYSTYLGGSSAQGLSGDQAYGIAVDAAGNAYITGCTTSSNFPTANAFQSNLHGYDDAFVTKLNPTGSSLIYSTYLGGGQVDIYHHDVGKGIAVDSAGNAYIAGYTGSTDFPLVNPVQGTNQGGNDGTDGFVTKMNSSGSALIYSTYLGGSASDTINAIAVDPSGYAYVTGSTSSTDFPTSNGPQLNFGGGSDAFISKLSITGTALVYSTYLGGTGYYESGNGIAVDASGNAYVTGVAASGFPTTAGSYKTSFSGGSLNPFVTKVNAPGSAWAYSTYLGGSGYGNAIAVDSTGNAFVVGNTNSNTFPMTSGSLTNNPVNNNDVFVMKLNAPGSALGYSTFFGGTTGDDYGNAIAINGSASVYITGFTASTDFPITAGAFQPTASVPTGGSAYETFVAKIADVSSYNVSGRLTDSLSNGISSNNIVVSGSQSWTAQTDSNGNYWIGGLAAAGNFTITPVADRYTVNPVNQTYNNLSANQTANFVGTLKTYTISGHITNTGGGALSGVSVSLSGSHSGSTQTDASGNYSFSEPAAGTYTISPSMTGVNFSPDSKTFSNLNANQTANFSAAFSISGQILSGGGAPVGNATVKLTGTQTLTTNTDVSGNYSFSNVQPQGNFTITPTLTGYGFTPASANFSNLASSQTANFTATTYSVGGQITSAYSGLPISGVYIILSGSQTGSATTDANGNYNFSTLAPGGTYTFTPTKSGYGITPQTLTNLGSSQTLNFSAASCVISGFVTDNYGYGLGTAQVTLSGSQTGTVFTNYQGAYSFNVPPGGTYTVTATYNGYTFNPSSQTFSNLTTDQRLDFQTPPNLVSGRVTDPNGNPRINLQICYSGSQTGCVHTDVNGNYHVNVALGGTYTITPSETYLAYIPTSQTFANLAANQTADFTALDQNSISGKLQSANHIGISGVTVTLSGTQSATTQTDAGGRYYFQNLAQGGSYWVTPVTTDYTFTPSSRNFVDCWGYNCGGSQPVDFTALANGIVPLNPTADAYVVAGSPTVNYGAASTLQVQNASSGPNSETYMTFDLAGISGNVATAKLRLYGALSDTSATNVVTSVYSVANTSWIESGLNSITWNTKPVSSPSPISTVTVIDNLSRWYEIDVSAFVAGEKAAGRNVLSLALKDANQSPPAALFNSREAGVNKPELVITTAPTISTLSPNSGPIGTSVTVTGDSFGSTQGSSTLTFNGIAATPTSWSSKSIVASVPAGAGTGPVTVTVNAVPSNSLTFTVTNTGTIAGRITKASDGTNINGAKVDVLQGGVQIATATTPSTGLYSIGILLAGTYDLRVSATGFGTVVQPGYQVTPGATTTVNVALANAGTIGGKVTGPNAVAISGATVKVFQGATLIGSATTNGTGDYSVGSLAAGTYTVEASASGYQTKSQTGVAVTAGSTTTVNLALNPATATYHIHKEASSTSGLFQLKTAGPDGTSLAIQTADLKSQATGEKLIKAFDTQAGDPNTSGTIFAGSTLSFTLWMKNTAALGTMFPRAKVFLNSASGASLCTATGTTALNTTLTKYTLTCNTSSNVVMTTADRLYLWVGVNLTVGSSSGTFKGEVDIEGTLNGNYDSLIAVPFPIPSPTITALSPSSGPVGTQVSITGTNFGTTQGTSTVTFNGKQASPSSWNNTTIVAPVPVGSLTGPVIVTVNALPSNSITFTVTGPGTISGTITKASDGTSVNGALVEILQYNVVKASASSAANGSYTVNGLQAGTYDVRVSATGFGTTIRTGNTVASGGTTTINVALSSTGTISGKVTSAGVAISGATVRIYTGVTSLGVATTNGTGDYTIATLAAGTYTVEASSAGYQTYSQAGVIVNAGATTTVNIALSAASGTYHLHTEASSTSGLFQLKTAGPDVASVALTSAELNGQPTTEYLIKAFDTQAGVPNSSGLIPSGSTITFALWMKKTANLGTMFPRAKLYLNNSSGTLLCNVTGATALTTTLTKYTFTGTTTSNIVVSASDRFYLWAGINLTVGSSSGTFKGELDIEGTLNGNFDSLITAPLPLAVPAIASITPGIGRIGDALTIAGVNFGSTQGTSSLTINGVTATALAWNNTSIIATVPSGAATGPAIVAVNGLPSNGYIFFVDTSPSITSLSPTWGPVGTPVTLSGINFGATQGSSTIRFNGVPATPTNWSSNSIVVVVPSGVVTGPVVVTVAGADSNGMVFKVSSTAPPPDPSGVSDTNGAVNLKVYTQLEPSP